MAEALRLADALMDYYQCSDQDIDQAAAELRRLHAENERLSATVKAREDEILTHSEAFYEATRLLSEEREKNERLAALVCDYAAEEAPDALRTLAADRDRWHAKAQQAEAQRDALLASLRVAVDSDLGRAWVWPDTAREQWMRDARAAIKAVEGEKT